MTNIPKYETAGRAACYAANYSISPQEKKEEIFQAEKAYWCDVAEAAIEAHSNHNAETQ